jgi:hypothetical protein
MADEQSTSGMVPGLVHDFIAQLHAITEGLENLAGFGEHRTPAPGGFLLPGALSAAQLTSIASSVAAQRRSIEALKAQLSSFDQQLAVLEQILAPLTEWSSTWAELEQRLLTMRREPPAQSPASGSLPENHRGRADRVPWCRSGWSARCYIWPRTTRVAPGPCEYWRIACGPCPGELAALADQGRARGNPLYKLLRLGKTHPHGRSR